LKNSHKKAQKGIKNEAKSTAGTAFWNAGLLARIVMSGRCG